ncbi:MAG: response regulator transcription factor [Actinomycetia bacterium]|nr:response regulator transcription factor [Actinomycetes bacterium]
MRLLLAEDEETIRDLLAASLRYAGFDVITAVNGNEAMQVIRKERPDAMVLDIMMPGMDGLEVVRRARSEGNQAPALFLTAKDATQDKVAGLAAGGDDYVTKPFALEEVIARIQALLRRAGQRVDSSAIRQVGDITLDASRHEVHKAGTLVELSPTEYKLLLLFLDNPDKVLSKATILDRVWEYDFDGEAAIVESYVSYLRRKIDTTEPAMLKTVRGFGYVLRPPVGTA